MRIFWSHFVMISKFLPSFLGVIWKFLLLQANLSLRACLAMCLIFRENLGSRAYKRVAYKKKCVGDRIEKRAKVIRVDREEDKDI